MSIVLVHGHPETAEIWDPFVAALDRSDVVALRLPGFGSPRPSGFDATKESYVDWLIETIEEFEEPVHLVGHDWGGALTIRVATLRSELLRSWASDACYVFDPEYEWHRFAKTWQTPGEGERDVQFSLATPSAVRAPAFERLGVPLPWAERKEWRGGSIKQWLTVLSIFTAPPSTSPLSGALRLNVSPLPEWASWLPKTCLPLRRNKASRCPSQGRNGHAERRRSLVDGPAS